MSDIHIELARNAIAQYVRTGRRIPPPDPLPNELRVRAGAFVSLKRQGELRGCIGTYLPSQENLACEIIENAISAATRDPRFPPVEEWELDDLDVSVDVLTTPEPVKDASALDAKRYGVIVKSGWRTGLLLPDLEGVNTPEEQISICMMKAGIRPGEPYELYRFEVERHSKGLH
ncbi:MAG: AmmeMemoRadiSam system protein A [Armatimonadota bacterium]